MNLEYQNIGSCQQRRPNDNIDKYTVETINVFLTILCDIIAIEGRDTNKFGGVSSSSLSFSLSPRGGGSVLTTDRSGGLESSGDSPTDDIDGGKVGNCLDNRLSLCLQMRLIERKSLDGKSHC